LDGIQGNKNSIPQKINRPSSTEESQSIFKNISPIRSDQIPSSQLQPPTTQQALPKTGVSETRKLGNTDVINVLFKIQQAVTPENKQLVTLMLQYGLEIDKGNFEKLQTLLKGNTISDMESAVIAGNKGLWNLPASVDMIGHFLQNQAQFSQQLTKVLSGLSETSLQFRLQSGLMDSGLMAAVSTVLLDLDDRLKKLNKKFQNDQDRLMAFNREGLMTDLKALYEFLGGIQNKSELNSERAKALKEALSNLREGLKDTLKTLCSQTILSTYDASRSLGQESYAYFQVPNPFKLTPGNIDILIKKDPYEPNSINPFKTKFVLRFETDDMGELVIVIDLQDQKVWYEFQTNEGETRQMIAELTGDLKERMEGLNYQIQGIKTTLKKTDIKKLLLPILNLDKVTRITADA